jgi:MtN3 and saliva related transmembrane protein
MNPRHTIRLARLTLGLLTIGMIILTDCRPLAARDTAELPAPMRDLLDELAVRDPGKLVSPRVQLKEILGFVAGLGTTFAAVPDVIAMLRRRSSAGMNPRMAAITGSFQIVWVYYGLLIASRSVILWNIIAVLINFFSVGSYFYYARKAHKS